jgi:hypothetical protein
VKVLEFGDKSGIRWNTHSFCADGACVEVVNEDTPNVVYPPFRNKIAMPKELTSHFMANPKLLATLKSQQIDIV